MLSAAVMGSNPGLKMELSRLQAALVAGLELTFDVLVANLHRSATAHRMCLVATSDLTGS